jgi:molybdenum cofactor biosynthesis protein B
VASGSTKPPIRVAAVTVSDTRTFADDEGGARLRERLEAAGFVVAFSSIVRDEPDDVRAMIARICDEDLADAIVATGGTGIAPRDGTYEAIDGLLEKRLDGFGEAFRRLSWDEIGPRAVLSRAVAGVHRGRIVAALPGSPKAVVLGVDRVLAPILAHAVGLVRGDCGAKHKHG